VISQWEAMLSLQIKAHALPEPTREHRFHRTRRWRFDFAWPALKLAAEVEGGTWSAGRHVRGAGFEADAEKYLAAALDGWCVFRFTPAMIRSGVAISALVSIIRSQLSRL